MTGNDVVGSQFDYANNANNPFRAGSGGYFDGYVYFGSGANPTIQSTTLILSADQDLDLTDLYERSVGGSKGPHYMAIHAQSTNWSGGNEADSEWAGANTVNNAVPEPATMVLLGSGLLGLAGFRRKLNKG